MAMSDARKKFQELLRELFQFDCADLDFGIYRIMNQKRAVIEQFIEKDLLAAVGRELGKGALKEKSELAQQRADIAAKIREDIADDAIDGDGKLADAHAKTKLGRQYLELQAKAGDAVATAELEAQVFNHLWAFFSRYFDNGDFLSTRRYSRREKYAIPYNGEEVYLHWANRDQYYIKTGEQFTDYQWKAGDVTVLFKLVQAETEKDNVKSDTKRLFVPRLDEVAVDKKTVTLPFEYRGLTEQEAIAYGKKNQQEAILSAALESLPKRKALREAPAVLAAMLAEYRKTAKGETVTRLEHHLRRYTGKNTRDYFIHKDLEGFLTRELDFYLKNEVLMLDDLAAGGAERAEGWFQLLEAIRAVGGKIVAFLAHIENFQKRVFEKRKFVTETNYCFTLDRVPKALWPRILKNKAQIEEWKKLYSIQDLKGFSDPLKPAFLEEWPSLMIDTAFFANDAEFIDALLAAQKNLEEELGGLLVHSENFQALNALAQLFLAQVACIHVDPPYNTETSGFLYKNAYQHSSWLGMIGQTVKVGMTCLTEDGAFLCHIDENEYERLHLLFDECALPSAGTIIWDKKNPMLGRKGVATQHEYIVWRTADDGPVYARNAAILEILEKAEKIIRACGGVNERSRAEYGKWISTAPGLTGGERSNRYIEDDGRVYQSVGMGAPEPRTDPKFHLPLVHPVTGKKCPVPSNGWSRAPVTLQDLIARGMIIFGNDENVQPRRKVYLTKESSRQISSVIQDAGRGKNDLEAMNLTFPYSHPLSLYVELVGAGCPDKEGVVLDFFAGSGTNGHAVVRTNLDDNANRRYVLVEMDEQFDTVLKPRMLKAVFARDWKDGKAVPLEKGKTSGLSHALKYIRLESFEDALGNIAFDGSQGDLKFDDYVLRYMLGFETRKSETLLNVEKLAAPFSYRLEIMEGGERKAKPVDLPETFNYLLGLKVSSRKVHLRDGKQRYLAIQGTTNPHGEGGERKVCVIWRDVTGWKAADFKADAEFVKQEKLAAGADEVFVNADSVIPGARVLDPVFKERMFAPVNV